MAYEVVQGHKGETRPDGAALLLWGAWMAFLVGGVVFLLAPELDLVVAGWFFSSHNSFVGNTPVVATVREFFKLMYIGACVLAILGVVFTYVGQRSWLGLAGVRWFLLLSCLIVGPGVVSNLALKDQWGRARPREVVQFGGEKSFSGPLVPSRQCARNCSFVSGEASSIFMIFFAAALLFRRRAYPLVITGVTAGSLAGLIRISQGGHFLSDVVFAGIAMAITAAVLSRLLETIAPNWTDGWDPEGEPAFENSAWSVWHVWPK